MGYNFFLVVVMVKEVGILKIEGRLNLKINISFLVRYVKLGLVGFVKVERISYM